MVTESATAIGVTLRGRKGRLWGMEIVIEGGKIGSMDGGENSSRTAAGNLVKNESAGMSVVETRNTCVGRIACKS